MSDIWKIWKIEFRKQRWEWIVSLVSLVILGILLFFLNNTQPEMWLFAVLCGFSVMLLMTERVISSMNKNLSGSSTEPEQRGAGTK